MNYAIIGDVHSQPEPLAQALDYCRMSSLTPILLGDLFDSQCSVSDSYAVYKLARKAQDDLGATILRSNHQYLLEQLARKEPIPLKKDLARTVKDFVSNGVCIREVGAWLESFPYVVALRDSQGLEYRIAHAEIPEGICPPSNYTGLWEFHTPTEAEKELLLWGKPYTVSDKERFWWLHPTDRDWIQVAGHYHKFVRKNMSLVLDGGCGGKTRSWFDKRLPLLLLYDVNQQEVVPFKVNRV